MPLPRLAAILDRVAHIIVPTAHCVDFVFFEETNEDILILRCNLAEYAGLIRLKPLAIRSYFLPFRRRERILPDHNSARRNPDFTASGFSSRSERADRNIRRGYYEDAD